LAQEPIKLPPARDGKLPNLVPVTAPSATCAAISETLGWLAFGHDRKFPDAHVSLVRLDAKGNPAAYSTSFKLPRPDALVKHANYPLSLAFHPKLPLLYVWQDIELNFTNPPGPQHPDLNKFDHLLIYSVAKDAPELVVSLCRGPDYNYGAQGGAVRLDSNGSYLYVPNLHEPKNPGSWQFGRFALDDAGLPKLDAKDAALPPPARAKRLAELNAAKPLLPHQLTPQEYIVSFPFNSAGSALDFVPIDKDVVIAAGWNGQITWRPEDKRVTINTVSYRHSGNKKMILHPHLPVIFTSIINSDVIYRVEHAEGYPTLLPQAYVLADAAIFSPPAILNKGARLVVGGRNRLYLVDLDAQGRCRPEVTQVRVFNSAVMALVYSERYDRLYVSVEVSK
jgi:hypothetical protein